ncbi:MAG: Tim44 domain-containing protein [Pseudomonadota bacterium]
MTRSVSTQNGIEPNFLTMLLLAAAAFFVIRWLLRRFAGGAAAQRTGGLQYAGAGAPAGRNDPFAQPMQRQTPAGGGFSAGALNPAPVAAAAGAATLPADFDAEGFARTAKMLFIRMQAANDAGQVDDLRKFTTPELFASLRLDLQERAAAAQQTDVVQLDAQVLEAVQEHDQWVVSVRFHGLIREEAEAPAAPFDENWHFVRPLDGSRDWAIAGITPAN